MAKWIKETLHLPDVIPPVFDSLTISQQHFIETKARSRENIDPFYATFLEKGRNVVKDLEID